MFELYNFVGIQVKWFGVLLDRPDDQIVGYSRFGEADDSFDGQRAGGFLLRVLCVKNRNGSEKRNGSP